jgi:hypothetical protein
MLTSAWFTLEYSRQASSPAVSERIAVDGRWPAFDVRPCHCDLGHGCVIDSGDALRFGLLDGIHLLLLVLGARLLCANGADGEAAAEAVADCDGALFQAHNDFDGLLVFDHLGVALCEVAGVLEEGPIAAGDVDDGEDDLVGKIVDVDEDPAEAFVLAAQVYLVEDDCVD